MSTDSPLPYPVVRSSPTEVPQEFAKLRREAPVCPVSLVTGDPAWLVTRHDDVKTVLADRRFSRARMCGGDAPRYQAVRPQPDSILSMDPPRHTAVRQLLNHMFTTRQVDRMRPRIQKITDELLDAMVDMPPPIDLNAVFGRPLPLRVVCEMIGVPVEDHQMFLDWTARVMTLTESAERIIETYIAMRTYFTELLKTKRANPGDDLMSMLIELCDVQGKLTESEVISLGTFLLVAGHDTNVTVLADSALTLMNHPDQLAQLRADPSLWPNAVEELLRLTNPGGSIFPRIATTDVRIGDAVIPEGSAVIAHIGSGCRDEEVVDDPDRFDIHRNVNFQIFFGHGPHFCLGAGVARAELQIGLRSLFDRFPGLSLAVPAEDLRWKDFAALGGWQEFPVTWK